MKQGNRHDYAVAPFEIHQNSLKTRQGVALDANSLSELKIGPRLGAVPGSHNRLNGGNLAVVYRKRNPAATDDPSSPIYGMPIIHADLAENVVFLKRSMRPGFAGIENDLLYNPKTTLVFGDAKDTLTKMVAAVKAG